MKYKARQGALNELLGMLMPSMLNGLDKKDKKEKKKPAKMEAESDEPGEPLESQEMISEPRAPKSRSISLTQLSLATAPKPLKKPDRHGKKGRR